MTFRKMITLGFLLPLVGVSALALAEPPGGGGPGGGAGHGPGGPPYMHIVQRLDLTAEQQAMVDDWKASLREHRDAMRAEREAERELVKEQLASGNPDAGLLHDLLSSNAAEREAFAHEQLDTFLAIYATLTPDQLATVREIIEEGPPERGEGRPGRSRGGRPGFESDRF